MPNYFCKSLILEECQNVLSLLLHHLGDDRTISPLALRDRLSKLAIVMLDDLEVCVDVDERFWSRRLLRPWLDDAKPDVNAGIIFD